MVRVYGMSEKFGFRVIRYPGEEGGIDYSASTKELIDNEVRRLLQVRIFIAYKKEHVKMLISCRNIINQNATNSDLVNNRSAIINTFRNYVIVLYINLYLTMFKRIIQIPDLMWSVVDF